MSLLSVLMDRLSALVALGGPVVALLMVLSVVSFAVILFKLWQFQTFGLGRHKSIRNGLQAWEHADGAGAQSRLKRSNHFLAPVLAEAVSLMAEKPSQVQQFRDRQMALLSAQLDRLDRGFRVLDSIAQVAPLLGLFGTVLGMIDAFQALQEAGSTVDPSLLAGGIWVALMTTAAGLAVAMPTQLVLTWLESRVAQERGFADTTIERILYPVPSHEASVRPENAGQLAHAG